jgi:hypothetical protein
MGPEVAPVQLSPFVPVTVHDETFEMFQINRGKGMRKRMY